MGYPEPTSPTDEQTTSVDARYQTELHAITAGFDAQRLAELSRLRASMGFGSSDEAKPRIVDGRYKIIKTLGSGGMGVVYLAEDLELEGSRVALKLVRESYLRDVPMASLSLRREAQQMAKLRGNPNVVMVHDVGSDDGSTYLTMEYVEGLDLRRWLKAEPRSLAQVLDVFLGAARGLQAAHAIGLVHRDFKPDNVLVDGKGVAKVTDFGVAGLADEQLDQNGETQPDVRRRGRSSAVRGTMAYIPPEQLGGERADKNSDQFSFCVALWEAISEQLPYQWRGLESQRAALAGEPLGAEALPRWLRPILRRGMAVARGDRHADMRTLIELVEKGVERPKRIKRTAIAATALVAAAGLGSVLYPMLSSPPPACELFEAEVEKHWNAERRDTLAERGGQFEVDVSWVLRELDELGASWSEEARTTCTDDQAPAQDDARRKCLEQWLISFGSAIELLTERGDRSSLSRAPELVASLEPPSGDSCEGVRLLEDLDLAELVADARQAAIVADDARAEQLSLLALERAESLASGREYTVELAHAHAARADVLRFRRDLAGASEHFEIAQGHAEALGDLPDLLLRVRVMWAWTLAHDRSVAAAEVGEGHLRRAKPLLHAANVPQEALIRAEMTETRALLDRNLGRLDESAAGYRRAFEQYVHLGNVVFAARAMIGAGVLEHERGRLAEAEGLLRAAAAQLDREDLPAGYRESFVRANYNLAVVLYERAEERYIDESLALLESVIAIAPPPLRLKALGAACQIAAEYGRVEKLRSLVARARAAIEAGEPTERIDEVVAQVELSALLGGDESAEASVETFIMRPVLDLELRKGVAETWLTHLVTERGCSAFDAAIAKIERLESEEFQSWVRERAAQGCN